MHSSESRTPPVVTIPVAPSANHSRELLDPTSPTSRPADSITTISPGTIDVRTGVISESWAYQYSLAQAAYSSGLSGGTAFSDGRSRTVCAMPVALAPWKSGAIAGSTVPLARSPAQSMPSRTSATRRPANRSRSSAMAIDSLRRKRRVLIDRHGADQAEVHRVGHHRRHAVVAQTARVDRRRHKVLAQRVHLEQRGQARDVTEVVAVLALGQRRASCRLAGDHPRRRALTHVLPDQREGQSREVRAATGAAEDD